MEKIEKRSVAQTLINSSQLKGKLQKKKVDTLLLLFCAVVEVSQ